MTKHSRLDRDALEQAISHYLFRRFSGEAYGFNIKIQKMNIPRGARRLFDSDVIDSTVQSTFRQALIEFTDQLQSQFHWLRRWSQEGRSGGWLVLEPEQAVLDNPDVTLSVLRKRLKDLEKIDRWVREAKKELVRALESEEAWNVPKQDWSPRD